MPFLAAIGPVAVASAPAIALVVTSALTATGEIIKCKTGPDKCSKKIKVRDDVPTAYLSARERQVLNRMAKRQAGACGVPQFNFDMCHEDLKAVTVQTSIPAEGVAQFDNVPASCLNLATALTGGCGVEPPYPEICGSACMKYAGLTPEQFQQLSDYLAPFGAE